MLFFKGLILEVIEVYLIQRTLFILRLGQWCSVVGTLALAPRCLWIANLIPGPSQAHEKATN